MTTIKLRRGTAAEWSSANPILSAGEIGFEMDSGKFKIGNGTDHFNSLDYYLPEDLVEDLIDSATSLHLAADDIIAGTNVTVDRSVPGQVTISSSGVGGGEGGVTDHGELTGLTDADHPISAIIGLQTALDNKESVGSVAAHVAQSDPHSQYLTPTEANALYSGISGDQVVRWDPDNDRWRYNGATITARPTTAAFPDGLVEWNTSTDPTYTTPPPLAVVGDKWLAHGSVVLDD